MNDTCSIGFEYVVEIAHKQELQLDSALAKSVQAVSTVGMQGGPLPYRIHSEWSVTCLFLICFSCSLMW